jgi:hypothetical protein
MYSQPSVLVSTLAAALSKETYWQQRSPSSSPFVLRFCTEQLSKSSWKDIQLLLFSSIQLYSFVVLVIVDFGVVL